MSKAFMTWKEEQSLLGSAAKKTLFQNIVERIPPASSHPSAAVPHERSFSPEHPLPHQADRQPAIVISLFPEEDGRDGGNPAPFLPSVEQSMGASSAGYYEHLDDREKIIAIGKTFAEYAHDQKIGVLLYPDVSARLLDTAVRGYWHHAYPGEAMPERYFINPQAVVDTGHVHTSLHNKLQEIAPTRSGPAESVLEQADSLTLQTYFSPIYKQCK